MTDFQAARQTMVDCQVRPADVTRYAIIEAMLDVPREMFVPKALRDIAYAESDVPLADNRALLAPRTFAKMLEALAIGSQDLVLDLAPGTGYSTAVMARCAAAVVAIESSEAHVKAMTETLTTLEIDNAIASIGDVAAGDPDHGPFDAIFVNGAVEVVPKALTNQLRDGGRLVAIFAGEGASQARVLVKAGDAVAQRYAFDATALQLPEFAAEREFVF